jgi:hypothetical protein
MTTTDWFQLRKQQFFTKQELLWVKTRWFLAGFAGASFVFHVTALVMGA